MTTQRGPTAPPGETARAPHRWRPPSLPARVAYGAWVYGVLAPAMRTLRVLGLERKAVSAAMSRRARRLEGDDPFRGYLPGPRDVVVSTYAKSGTHWMLQVAHQLLHHGRGEYAHLHDVVPWPDDDELPRLARGRAVPLDDDAVARACPEGRRVIKTHLPARRLRLDGGARFLVVVRDPKDVFVSGYHFVRDTVLGPAMPSVRTWLRLFLQGKALGGSWPAHAAGWWRRRHLPGVAVFSFKAMKADLERTVRAVARHLGVAADDDVVARVCARSSFDAMRADAAKYTFGRLLPWRRERPVLRRGAHGGSAELLTPAQQRELDATMLHELGRHGSDLPYDDFAERA